MNGETVAGRPVPPWQELAPLPKEAGKRASALVWTGTHVIAWGGYTDSPMEETAAGFMLNPVLDKWRPLPAGGGGRRGHTALWTPHGLLIAGGHPTAQPVLFTPVSGEPVPADRPNPIRPETNEMVWGVLSIGLLLLAVVIAALVVACLLSARRR